MNDILIYCPDTAELVAELQTDHPARVSVDQETGKARFLVDKTPTVRHAETGETLALVRIDDATLAALETLDSIQALGTYDQVFADPALRAIYDSVYDQSPRTWTDDDGVEHTHTPPERIGAFA